MHLTHNYVVLVNSGGVSEVNEDTEDENTMSLHRQ